MLLVADINHSTMTRVLKACTIALALAVTAHGQITKPPVRVVNTPGTTGATAVGSSSGPAVSANGRYVAFCSNAKDLVAGQGNPLVLDVFLRDVDGGTTAPISLTTNGVTGGNGNSGFPMISADGSLIAFVSGATNLTSPTSNSYPQLFVRNLASNTTEIVSVNSAGTSILGGVADYDMTPEGRYLVFVVSSQIYWRDRFAHTTSLVTSRASNPTQPSAGRADTVNISTNGQRVIYTSAASDLASGNSSVNIHAYLYDAGLQTNSCLALDVKPLIGGMPQASSNVTISADGSAVAFVAVTNASYLIYETTADRQPRIVATNIDLTVPPLLSSDGGQVLYRVATNGITNVYLWNAQTAVTQTINITTDGHVNGDSIPCAMSSDGTRIVFVSNSTNLTADIANGLYQVYIRDTLVSTTRLVSVTSTGSAPTSQLHSYPTISSDGSRIVFTSADNSFVPNDNNRDIDMFVWSWATGQIQLVSTKDAAQTSNSDVGAIAPASYSVTSNGTFVTFAASDGALAANDTNGLVDVFARNILTGTTTFASDDGLGGIVTDRPAASPAISSDGRYVAYVRPYYWTNLNAGNVLIRDLQPGGFGVRTNFAFDGANPAFTPDGRYVVYQTTRNMAFGGPPGFYNIYGYDILSNINIPISPTRATAIVVPDSDSTNAVVSPDSRWVTFLSASQYKTSVTPTTTSVHVYARNLMSNTTILVSAMSSIGNCSNQTFSADSQVIAYSTSSSGLSVIATHNLGNSSDQIVVYNATNPSLNRDGTIIAYNVQKGSSNQIYVQTIGTTKSNLVSVGYDGVSLARSNCSAPILTADGRFVIFTSTATNLVANDTNSLTDIFVRDLVLSNTFAISGPVSSVPSLGAVNPVVAADGRTIVFQSFSLDLNTNILTANRNLFIARIMVGDSDHDGMDDDWEMTYFGDLSHDGTADTDGDGMTDLQEFLAGTNPINNDSVLRCLTVTTSVGGATIYWSAVPGHNYRVEYKDSVDGPTWTTLVSSMNASYTTQSVNDFGATLSTQRFYRVTALP
jgi:Tol biopolymer transport system component